MQSRQRMTFEQRRALAEGRVPPGGDFTIDPVETSEVIDTIPAVELSEEVVADAAEVTNDGPDLEYYPPSRAISDGNALVRDPDDGFSSTGEVIPIGTGVNIMETREVNGRTYVRVMEVLPEGTSGPVRTWWTSEGNLGSPKEFDQDMVPDRLIDLTGLTGLDRSMAIIYNTKGRFIQEEADRLGVPASTLAGILQIEARGVGFNDDGTPIIRFENHQFYNRWGNDSRENRDIFNDHFQFSSGRTWTGHKFREDPNGSWQSFHGDQYEEYQVLAFARALSDEQAIQSMSIGAGQVMGFNHEVAGYDSAREMFDDMSTGIEPQLRGMIGFIENCGNCMTGMRNGNFTTFASGYNGSGQAEYYGGLIEDAAASYDRILDRVPPATNN